MSDFVLKTDGTPGVTSVSNLFLDYYMPGANGEYVKVYLYLLRALNCPDISLSVAGLADVMDKTESDILRALKYWEKQGILSLECDDANTLQGIYLCTIPDPVAKKSEANATISLRQEKEAPRQNLTARKSSMPSRSSQNAGSFSLCATSTLEKHCLLRRLRPFSIFMTSFISLLI